MRLSTRIRLSYITVFVIPVIIILAVVLGFMNYNLNILKEKYDLDKARFEMLLDPSGMAGHTASTSVEKLYETIRKDPDRLRDQDYLSMINDELKEHFSGLIVWENGSVIYSGAGDEYRMIENGFRDMEGLGNEMFIRGSSTFHIQKMVFSFSDGSDGVILIFTGIRAS